jgi:hypothetical protein
VPSRLHGDIENKHINVWNKVGATKLEKEIIAQHSVLVLMI